MTRDQEIIAFKTGAWQSASMVANYAAQMHSSAGTMRLKNTIEVGVVRSFAVGETLLDVGVGTGRGSLPLAREGRMRVTGIDASLEMLHQCRREAGGTPVDLLQGDLTSLPVEANTFDTLIAINVASHFPNWEAALREWARVVKPNGRLIFDIHAMDHLSAVGLAKAMPPEDLLTEAQRHEPIQFFARVGARELARAAESAGLSLVRLVPYGSLYGGQNVNYWFVDGLLWGSVGDRMLSNLTIDERMFTFAEFIEREIVARMSTRATPRFMAVLEKRVDVEATQAECERGIDADRALLAGDFDRFVGGDASTWRETLLGHLDHAPNLALAAAALSTQLAGPLRPAIESLAGKQRSSALFDAHERLGIERAAEGTLAEVRAALSADGLATFGGVDYAAALDYAGYRGILDDRYYHLGEAR